MAREYLELYRAMVDLSPDEEELVWEVILGLKAGRPLYGAFEAATDPRNFRTEASAEQRDLAVYLAMEVVRRRRAQGGAK